MPAAVEYCSEILDGEHIDLDKLHGVLSFFDPAFQLHENSVWSEGETTIKTSDAIRWRIIGSWIPEIIRGTQAENLFLFRI